MSLPSVVVKYSTRSPWGDNDDVYRIEPDYDYNDTEDELIVTFNLKELTEEQSEL